jgi:N-acetylglucosamine-6-phosphate deacetylase
VILGCRRILGASSGVLDGWVRVASGRIAEVGTGVPPGPVRMLPGWLAPGFIDLHVHGGGGASFQSGRAQDAARVAEFHRSHGTTTMLASLVTAPVAEMAATVRGLAEAVAAGVVAGVHLEGPFLSEQRRGAHAREFLRDPEPAAIDELLASGPVAMISLAPERPGGLGAVRRVAEAGVVAAVGHTDATYELTRDAVKAGATVATHLCNGMRPLHHREPGPILALLEDHRVTVEVINDGFHVHPAAVAAVFAAAGDRVALVTDAIAAAGMPDGEYLLGVLDVVVRDGVPRLIDGGSIAGSTLTMAASVRRAVRHGIAPEVAVAAATATPARVLRRDDIGRIAPGARADLVLLDDSFAVQEVWRA